MRELEAQRLRELILAWLVVERERAPFQVLKLEARGPGEAQTGEAVREFEGLRLRLRPDRVDVDERGQGIVLDYKTGVRKPAPGTARKCVGEGKSVSVGVTLGGRRIHQKKQ